MTGLIGSNGRECKGKAGQGEQGSDRPWWVPVVCDTDRKVRASFDREDGATAAVHCPGHRTGAHDERSRTTKFFASNRRLIRDVACTGALGIRRMASE